VAEEMADRIGIMHLGRLIAAGTWEELRRQSGESGPLERTFLALTAQEANAKEESALKG
jgi:ABC-type multidrug transport system ATPase subunit